MNLFAELDRNFASLIGATKLPDTPALPEVTEHFGVEDIQTGNSDLEQPAEWQPWTGPIERAPLPGHEHHLTLADSLCASIIAKARRDGIFGVRS